MIEIEIETEMIRNDLEFCTKLWDKNPTLYFQLLPHLCLIILEIYSYSNAKIDNKRLENIRAKAKFLDDNKIDIEGAITLLNDIRANHKNYFYSSHKGVFGRIKMIFQKDIGEFRYQGSFVGTTILYHYNISLSSKSSSLPHFTEEKAYNLGYEIGQLIGAAVSSGSIKTSNESTPKIREDLFRYKDYKSEKYFAHIFYSELTPGVAELLLTYLSMLNFVYLVLDSQNTNSFSLFKIRYITIFHVISSIRKLQGYFRKISLLSDKSDIVFRNISSDSTSKLILANKNFRNTLVHYRIKKNHDHLDKNKLFFGLVENSFDSHTAEQMKDLVNAKIESTITILDAWMRSDIPSHLTTKAHRP